MLRLGDAVRYPTPPAGRIRAVDIVYVDHASWLRTLILYTGDEPARRNQPVLSPAGLVGRVVAVSGPYAKVQLITDRAGGRRRHDPAHPPPGGGARRRPGDAGSSSTTSPSRPTCGPATAC